MLCKRCGGEGSICKRCGVRPSRCECKSDDGKIPCPICDGAEKRSEFERDIEMIKRTAYMFSGWLAAHNPPAIITDAEQAGIYADEFLEKVLKEPILFTGGKTK